MIDHVTILVSNLQSSKRFYAKAFHPLGYKISFGEEGVFWAFDIENGLFEISQSGTEQALTGFHIAFRVENREKVRKFYSAALEAGAVDNGAPGPRPHYTENYYACFVLDPDGHNIEAVFDAWNK